MVKSTRLNINLFLVGFSGSGKSTVGPALAQKLQLPFFDSDEMIVKQRKMRISFVFALEGEIAFRKYEQETIRKIVKRKKQGMVVALGGGAFANPQNRKLIGAKGITVYLRCNIGELTKRLSRKKDRPLLGGITSKRELNQKIGEMMNQRRKSYEKADLIVSTSSSSTRETVSAIIKKLLETDANN